MKRFICVLLSLIMLLSMTACTGKEKDDTKSAGSPDKEKNVKIGLAIAGMTMPYHVRMYEGFMEAAKKNKYEVLFADGGSDAESAVKAVEDLVNSGIDALAVSAGYGDAFADVFARCANKNIPIFYIGTLEITPATRKHITFWVGTKNESAGYLVGAWVAKYLDGKKYKKDLNIVEVSIVHDSLHQRYTGFVRGLEENGYTVHYINTVGDLTRENSLAGCEDMLTAHDDIDIFFGTAATSALGAYDATQNAGRTEVMVVGFDGEDEERAHIDEKGNYIATVCQQPKLESQVTVDAIRTVLEGGKVEGGHEAPAIVYGTGVGYVND